ncbi:hypothetical protein L1280_002503 [Deinococcus sp. HSC-46F16]|uniref:hypothetical protein n=1 Tax=unclassified Deinococcus TaxID=2623546 RepID=UPI000CF41E14|nr:MULTISPECIES: hypothetical protein [unclassified Deinococcus]MCP2015341.1 hypothetical protein [Deinococcus sp. HSC-46F16]
MFGRRVPPHIVFALSVLLAVLCAIPAVRYGLAENWLPALIWGAVAVWFAVDAVRSYGWRQQKKS